ncbi:hypothetical protein XPR_4537, partial [Xanthomonas arboricola pv. pruni MAFF 301420]
GGSAAGRGRRCRCNTRACRSGGLGRCRRAARDCPCSGESDQHRRRHVRHQCRRRGRHGGQPTVTTGQGRHRHPRCGIAGSTHPRGRSGKAQAATAGLDRHEGHRPGGRAETAVGDAGCGTAGQRVSAVADRWPGVDRRGGRRLAGGASAQTFAAAAVAAASVRFRAGRCCGRRRRAAGRCAGHRTQRARCAARPRIRAGRSARGRTRPADAATAVRCAAPRAAAVRACRRAAGGRQRGLAL